MNEMKLKERIDKDYILAFKAKDVAKKSALSMLKSKITEAEKVKSGSELTDDSIMKIIVSTVKQRKQSIEDFEKAGRTDLVENETSELNAIMEYMPSQMDRSEIEREARTIFDSIDSDNPNKKIGMTMGAFNKKFSGRADSKIVMEVIKSFL
jgi:uncharacterized protein YqeY